MPSHPFSWVPLRSAPWVVNHPVTQHEPCALEVFLAATAWYWYTYFAPRLWPVDMADPVVLEDPTTDTAPKAATPVTLPAVWESEAHNEARSDVCEA